jgi:hypothetical protein
MRLDGGPVRELDGAVSAEAVALVEGAVAVARRFE